MRVLRWSSACVQYFHALRQRARDEVLYTGLQGVLYMRLQT